MPANTAYILTGKLTRPGTQYPAALSVGVVANTAPPITVTLEHNTLGTEIVLLQNVGDTLTVDLSHYRAYSIEAPSYPVTILWLESTQPLQLTAIEPGIAAAMAAAGLVPTGALTFIDQASAPATPPAGQEILWKDTSGNLWLLSSGGSSVLINGGEIAVDTGDTLDYLYNKLTAGTGITFAYTISGGIISHIVVDNSAIGLPLALTGATVATRFVGGTASGAPTGTHPFLVGDYVITQDAHIFVCTAAGSPGTWADAGAWGSGGSGAGLLAITAYNPSGTDTPILVGSQADVDATNLAVTFTAPVSGNVLVRLTCLVYAEAVGATLNFGLREGTLNIAGPVNVMEDAATGPVSIASRAFYLTGIAAGAHTYKWAASSVSAQGNMRYGGTYGQAIMEVWAGP